MAGLTDKDSDRLEQRLRQRREELRWIIHDVLVESKRADYVDLAGAVHDAAEESVADLLHDMDMNRLRREVEEIADVEAALERISDGSYGQCIDCGDDITAERLEAYPTAKRCITCQTKQESDRRGGSQSRFCRQSQTRLAIPFQPDTRKKRPTRPASHFAGVTTGCCRPTSPEVTKTSGMRDLTVLAAKDCTCRKGHGPGSASSLLARVFAAFRDHGPA